MSGKHFSEMTDDEIRELAGAQDPAAAERQRIRDHVNSDGFRRRLLTILDEDEAMDVTLLFLDAVGR